ncbi:M28 family peptidase [Sphingomonas yunnanensis]|uniref:transferrin receptor-like dimerization domain-containing protein n=1 Tax=Sphingomonas yunnanensis TaxID=310400 RepID=UPI001CA79A22|nr:transferrin receptor-like dimerization domain-containing protein [Sphingomonas yunnanensis]MBY9064192.1 M28 family peptidase [Sphingomonas yunnanensis]
MIPRLLATAALLALPLASVAQTAPAAPDPRARERAFDAQISSADQLAWLKEMSSAPNHVGSPHDRANAEMQLALFKRWGWDARIETFEVLYPTPISTTLELVAPERATLGGQEPAVAEDPSSAHLEGALPPYVAYQGDGDVTAPVVYVNYGMPDDYEALAARGIGVKGKIVLARYGGGWRGLKPKLAQEHGAAGCLIYSDPADDGYGERDPYPRGGGRPERGVQRGSVQDMTQYPGDPLTPGVGATPGAKRLTRATAPTILKIPALPISYGDASRIMARLEGPVIEGGARGGLALAYHWGGTDAVKVHLAVTSDWSMKTLYDVIATLPGRTRPDEWVVRGNHRDGWVFGASDPLTGQVALMSEAKALGALAQAGWRPDRTIVYASWDGEEPGLLGSTEWVEAHADELARKAVLYVNTDGNGRGFLSAEGSHDLQHLVNAAARDVTDPQTSVSVLDRLQAHVRADAYAGHSEDAVALAAAKSGGDMPLGALGSGSDYSAFLQHLGIPSLDIGFGGEGGGGGSYHSIYDSFYHVTTFDDPGLVYGAVLSKMVGRLVLRAADGPRVPARYGDFAATVARYVGEVKTLAAEQRERDRTLRDLTRERVFTLASHPDDPTVAPRDKGVTPLIDMLALEDAADRLGRTARAADAAVERLATLPPATQARTLALLRDIDQLLIDPKGLPGRPWFRNLVYAPGTLTGYGAKTLPGVREAIEQRRFSDATAYVAHTAAVLNAYADRLDAAVATAR